MNKIHLVPPRHIEPVEPVLRDDVAHRGEIAGNIVLKYLQGVAMIYEVDEQELIEIVQMRLMEAYRA